MSLESAFDVSQRLRENVQRVVLGNTDVVRSLVLALLAGEHVLLEDVPGVGKTLAAKALARSVEGKFTRVQFTPDLLPSDILGSSLYRSDRREFEFSPGPIFTNVLLADEINRAPPRTQSGLLEAMSERQVTADGTTYPLPQPFLVVATQNPYEFEGTYSLPESQLDRFLLRTSVGYPQREVELEVLATHRMGEPVEALEPVVTAEEVREVQTAVRQVRFDTALSHYLLEIVHATRESEEFRVGVSTRGALSYYRACQARAITDQRDFVTPEDVKALAVSVLSHRVLPYGYVQVGDRESIERQVAALVEQVPVPR